ncbi:MULTISPECIES: DUF4238 domain-containing protein [unclassified Sphingomonas]|uniref:DUF4238 domain-containing protein n=1 Tax=unclassified Sphingomonas TaxID=196159 RepID=UPI0009E8C20C|nr:MULTISPECIES: DUF4238 domain-containing protein [unclassified Sphingomonas]MDY0966949.1 DUF4238 domain-containing protein [Sphingomonas sp. CFBP9021]
MALETESKMTSNPPRRHHYIPEFYQRNWAGSDRQIERYEWINGSVIRRRVFPKAAGFRENMYRHPRTAMDEWTAQALEWAIFAKVDDAAAKALDAMLSDPKSLNDYDVREPWSVFLRGMLMRTPYQMEGMLASLESIWRKTSIAEKYENMRQPGMPDTANEYLEMLQPNIVRDSAFQIFADAQTEDRTTRHIMRLPWRIFDCSSADHRLILSDHPVALVPLATEDGHIAMPLSPTKFLVIATSDRTKAIANSLKPKLVVRILNKLTVQRARHCVIVTDRTQERYILKHFGAEPIPPFLGGG